MIDIELWRARIGTFGGSGLKAYSRISTIDIGGVHRHRDTLIACALVVVLLTLCGDVESNPGPATTVMAGQGQDGTDSPQTNTSENHDQLMSVMRNLGMKMDVMTQNQISLDNKVSNLQHSVTQLQCMQSEFRREITEMSTNMETIRRKQDNMLKEMERERSEKREQNIRVFSFPTKGADTEDGRRAEFIDYCQEKLGITLATEEINRIKISGQGRSQHWVVKLLTWSAKMKIFKNLKNLKISDPDSKISFDDDLTMEELARKKANQPLFKDLKRQAGPHDVVQMRRGEIYVNKKPYRRSSTDNPNYPEYQPSNQPGQTTSQILNQSLGILYGRYPMGYYNSNSNNGYYAVNGAWGTSQQHQQPGCAMNNAPASSRPQQQQQQPSDRQQTLTSQQPQQYPQQQIQENA